MWKESVEIRIRELELKAGGAKVRATVGLPQAPSGWVVFAHEGGASLHGSALASVAHQLNAAGLATLSMELLTPAESARLDRLGAEAMSERLLAGTEGLHSEAGGLLGVVGAGEGASAALWAASEKGSGISSVVACAPQLEAAADRLGEVDAHTLLIVGGADRRALRQARWARRRLAHSEMVVVPGATRLFDAPAALRVLSERSVDWFQKTLVGDDRAEEVACERLSRESKRRLAAVASVFLMSGWALAPKVYPAITAWFDATGTQNAQALAGHLGVAISSSGDTDVSVGVSGGNVVVLNGAANIDIRDSSVPGGGSIVSVTPAQVKRIVVNTTGQIAGAVQAGNRTYDLSAVTSANGFAMTFNGPGSTNQATIFSCLMADGSGNSTLIGSGFADSLAAGGGNDLVVAGDGSDRGLGQGGNDVIYGDDGNDNLVGAAGIDSIYGGAGNDAINTSAGDNITFVTPELAMGGDGDDTLQGDHNLLADGEAGIDRFNRTATGEWDAFGYEYAIAGAYGTGATVSLKSSGSSPTTYVQQFYNCEIGYLTGGGDITNNPTPAPNADDSVANSMDASGWSDPTTGLTLDAGNGTGTSLIIGSTLGDTIRLTYGDETAIGGGGDDLVFVNLQQGGFPGRVAIYPTMTGGANDSVNVQFEATIQGSDTATTVPVSGTWHKSLSNFSRLSIQGTAYPDSVAALPTGDTIDITQVALASVVTVAGNDGADSIVGSANADVLNGQNGPDTLLGGGGNDTITGGAGDDSLVGQAGDDNLNGSGENDTLQGNEGNDTLNPAAGNGSLDGGPDTDVLVRGFGADADTLGAAVTLTDATLSLVRDTLIEGNALANFEQANLTGGGHFFFYPANSVNDAIDASAFTGRVSLSGAAGGDDTLIGGPNDDTIAINFGADSLVGGGGTDLLYWNINIDTDSVVADAQYSTVPADVRVTLAGGVGDAMQFIFGTDTVSYGLDGFENVQLVSGAGNDILDIGNVTNPLAAPTVSGNNGNDSIVGSPLADQLNGNAQNDTIEGNDGADTLFGGNQDDNLAGGAGDDQYDGLAGIDVISDAGGVDTVNLSSVTAAVVVKVGSLAISDTAGNKITGEGVDDVIGTTLNDLFQVTLGGGSTLATNLYLDGNVGDDTLIYDPTGLDNVATVGTLAAGTISATGKPDVDFANMENLFLRAVVSGARTWQEFE
ncbi:MAG: calcium-binding protein [Candidatus Sumerlaeota bacterium]|nr:calcium-binding protein [Candidatus Sumerlaeota bacterium]